MIIPKHILSILLFLMISGSSVLYSQSKDQVAPIQLQFLKNNFNWDDEDFLIIGYRNSKNHCTQYKIENNNESDKNDWILSLMSSANIKNAHEILVINGPKSYKNSKNIFQDKDEFIYNEFLNTSSCYSLLIFNENGNYISRIGEFTEFDIRKIINQLKP